LKLAVGCRVCMKQDTGSVEVVDKIPKWGLHWVNTGYVSGESERHNGGRKSQGGKRKIGRVSMYEFDGTERR